VTRTNSVTERTRQRRNRRSCDVLPRAVATLTLALATMASTKPMQSVARAEQPAPRTGTPGKAEPAVPDERDALIGRLERDLAEERQNAGTLREAADNLRFKAEILEKSYAKQLADARQRASAAEQALVEHRANTEAFGADREETVRLLKEARAELAQTKLDRDQLRQQLSRGNSFDRSPLPGAAGTEPKTDGGTINQLIANADWLKKKEPTAPSSHLQARVSADHDAPPIDMISPELVFTKERDED